MATFRDISLALRFTVETLVSKGHRFIISIRRPGKDESRILQLVAETMVYKNDKNGLTIDLPFDPSNGVSEEFLRFLECPLNHFFDKYVWCGIPCFALRLGADARKAKRIIELLLAHVWGYPTGTEFECEVSEEGGPNEGARPDRRARSEPASTLPAQPVTPNPPLTDEEKELVRELFDRDADKVLADIGEGPREVAPSLAASQDANAEIPTNGKSPNEGNEGKQAKRQKKRRESARPSG